MVVVVTQTPQGVAFSINAQPTETLPWIEGWTFRKRDVLLSFRAGPTSDRAAELRFDKGGDHFILKRVATAPLWRRAQRIRGTYREHNLTEPNEQSRTNSSRTPSARGQHERVGDEVLQRARGARDSDFAPGSVGSDLDA